MPSQNETSYPNWLAMRDGGREVRRTVRLGLLLLSMTTTSCGARTGAFLDTSETGAGPSFSAAGHASSGGMSEAQSDGGGPGSSGGGPGLNGGTGGSSVCGTLIDDMEDASGRICTGEGRQGAWYVFNDGQGSQQPPKTIPGVPIETSPIAGGRSGSTRAIHTAGNGFRAWGAGVGFDLAFDGVSYGLYDATRYSGFSFWARGKAGQSVNFRVSSESTTAMMYGGTCAPNCAGPIGVPLLLGPNWIKYTVSKAELGVLSEFDRLTNIQFDVRGGFPFDFWIDDIRFLDAEAACCSPLPECQGGATLADPALRLAVQNTDNGRLSCSAVCWKRIVTFSPIPPSPGVRDLQGLECLSSLATLKLSQNQIADLSPLSNLTGLVNLALAENQLVDLGSLRKLTNLSVLVLSKNEISDLGALQGLVGLSTLSLDDNQIQDLSPIGALSELTSLDLTNNAVSTMTPLSGLNRLVTLKLANNSIDNIGTLSGLSALTSLDLNQNRIVDVRPLAALSALTTLTLAQNQIVDPGPLGALSELTSLDLTHNAVTSMTPLSGLNRLATLNLANNAIGNIGTLSGLSALSSLDLSQNRIVDVQPLTALGALGDLNLAQNQIVDPSPLSALRPRSKLDLSGNQIRILRSGFSMPGLERLNLSSNGLSQIERLQGSVCLLDLSHNLLTDVSGLSGVAFFDIIGNRGGLSSTLNLSDNQITDLSSLLPAVFPTGVDIDLRRNPISCSEQAANIAALRARGGWLSIDCP